MSEGMKEVNVKYVKVCDRHGYCVMKIKPNEVFSSSPPQDVEPKQKHLQVTKSKKSNLIRTQKHKQNTGKITFEKETQEEDIQQKEPIRYPPRNPFISKISDKTRGTMKGMRVDEITLTTTDDHASE